jgi:hypothetical protein
MSTPLKILLLAALFSFGLPTLTPSTAHAQASASGASNQWQLPTRRVPRYVLTTDIKSRIEPVGLFLDNTFRSRNVYGREGSILLEGAYWQWGVDMGSSPALVEPGVHFEIMPIRLLIVKFEYRAIVYFGAFGYGLSFGSADAAFGDDEVNPRIEAGDHEFGTGHRFGVLPTFQLAAGPIILRNVGEYYYQLMNGFDGPYVRERLHDQLLRTSGDFMMLNATTIAYALWDPPGEGLWILGPYYEYTRGFDAGTTRHRVGGVTAFIAADQWRNARRPRVYLQSGVNLQDTNREGAFFIQGGFGFDLWIGDR